MGGANICSAVCSHPSSLLSESCAIISSVAKHQYYAVSRVPSAAEGEQGHSGSMVAERSSALVLLSTSGKGNPGSSPSAGRALSSSPCLATPRRMNGNLWRRLVT